MQVFQWLAESHEEFLAALDGISDEQWEWNPAPGLPGFFDAEVGDQEGQGRAQCLDDARDLVEVSA